MYFYGCYQRNSRETSLWRLQKDRGEYEEKQEKGEGEAFVEEILQGVSETHVTVRDEIVKGKGVGFIF